MSAIGFIPIGVSTLSFVRNIRDVYPRVTKSYADGSRRTERAPLANGLAFLASLIVHGVVMAVFLRGFFRLNTLDDPKLAIWALGCLLLITALGFVARRFIGARWGVPIGVGVLAAAAMMTATVLLVSWALSAPISEPPPFLDFLSGLLRLKNAGLWIAGPVVLTSLASALGYALGGIRRRRDHAAPLNSGAA